MDVVVLNNMRYIKNEEEEQSVNSEQNCLDSGSIISGQRITLRMIDHRELTEFNTLILNSYLFATVQLNLWESLFNLLTRKYSNLLKVDRQFMEQILKWVMKAQNYGVVLTSGNYFVYTLQEIAIPKPSMLNYYLLHS